jgi:hypothetical protein
MKPLRNNLRSPFALIAAFACLLALANRSAADTTPETFSAVDHPSWLTIRLFTDRSEYELGAQILVKITQTNSSPGVLAYNHVAAHLDYDVIITHGSSVIEPYPVEGRTGHPAVVPIRQFALQANATVSEPGSQGDYSPISDWGLKIEQPGVYSITAISRETKQRSNAIEIKVTQ